MSSVVQRVTRLPAAGPFETPDPFLFCVYHKDKYPAGNSKMEAPRVGNGADFDPDAEYRMYHGDRIPGFPQHPHRGFETITATIEGLVDHTDSLGNAGRYGQGDLQWMTAGKGICHGEMFPLINEDKPNHTRFFQIWLNLPSKSKMVEPAFVMHWANQIPHVVSDDGKTNVTLWAGTLAGKEGLPPPPDSYASDPGSDVAVLHIALQPGARYTLPATRKETNRNVYVVEGDGVAIGGTDVKGKSMAILKADVDAPLVNSTSDVTEVLVLQGRPIGEPVAQHGPFVMNTQAEIRQAFLDYQTTRFGGWPWPEHAMAFPREKGRFALQNGEETHPDA